MLKIIGIGAGINGILAAIKMPRRIENLDLVIYEKNPEVGGTWYENTYPGKSFARVHCRSNDSFCFLGVACDIPAHSYVFHSYSYLLMQASYQLTFEPNSQWSQFFATGPEILKYWIGVAKKYNCYKYIRLSHECVGAKWNEQEAKWYVRIKNVETGNVFEDSCDIFYPCMVLFIFAGQIY